MGAVRLLAVLLLLPLLASAQPPSAQPPSGKPLDQLPSASLPLGGTELLYIEQGGQDRKTTENSIGGLSTVTDGTTSVPFVTQMDFISGCTVTSGGSGIANLNCSASGGPFLPLAGGTVSGPTTFNGGLSGVLTVPNGKSAAISNSLTFTGTDGTSFLFPGTSDTVAGLAQNQTFTGSDTFGANAQAGIAVSLNGASGNQRSLRWNTNSVQRWQLFAQNNAESGLNSGSDLYARAFLDSGASNGSLFQASRASGPYGTGIPYFNYMTPYEMNVPRATTYGGILGTDMNFGNTSDYQPTATLGNNPLTTTNTSETVTVNWPNCCGATSGIGGVPGPLYPGGGATWVNLSGVTAVGGITPNGWLEVQSLVDANDFTVTWTSPATSGATGGGSAVVVRPSFTTQGTKFWITMKTGADGFPEGHTDYYIADPDFYQLSGSSAVEYQREFSQTYTPNDTTQTHAWGVTSHEFDLINRGADQGYSPNLYGALNLTVGMWGGPEPNIISFISGGGTSQNWNTVYSCFTGNHPTGVGRAIGVYDCNSNQPNSLVGTLNDTVTSHGGVGYDFFGSYDLLANPPFATTISTSTITVTTLASSSGLQTQTNGNSVYIPQTYTLNGVSFGAGAYTFNCVGSCLTATQFTITGSGTASATGTGGSPGQIVSFATLAPYAPTQFQGRWTHGISTTSNTSFVDGLIVNTQPGNAMGWGDGSGTAKVVGTEVTAGNVSVDLVPAGTAPINAKAPLHLQNYIIAAGAGQIPACVTALKGAVAYVTDFSGSPTYNGAIGSGGGSVGVPVACDGSSWTTH